MNTIIRKNGKDFKFEPNSYNILIVEDSKLVNNLLKEKFLQIGYNCFSTFRIKDAKEILKKNRIDYIILDMDLPDGSGDDIIKTLDDSSAKVFVLSGSADRVFQEKTYEKGIIEFFTKDHDFFYKVDDIASKIEQLERNRQKTILIVDDSLKVQTKLKNLLGERHYNIESAFNTKDALEVILSEKIDLILLDVQMKRSNGIKFLENNKVKIILEKKIPVIFLADHINQSIIWDGLKAGAVDVIKKPFVSEEIILKVNLWIVHKQQEEDISKSTKLLTQYKDTVDRSSIVSKANHNGIITYVNEQFCKVSGYSKDELIGASHNILRHEDTSNEVYKELWETIELKKEPWEGILKNRKKNGEIYWISTIINPILDTNNNIVEYIAICNDITDDVNVKEYFQEQLDSSSDTLWQAIWTSNEYKRAMNESSILTRTNLSGEITFVNEEFCKVTGYSKDEILTHTHSIISHEDTKREVYKHLWHTITSGKTWKGILKNKTKSGKSFWADSTIVPIKNRDGEVMEYMCIRNDLTKLFDLHDEIDHTQKEIIYRMGEIGETRSKETGNHVKRVAAYSKILGKAYGLEEKDVEILFTASPMHDIGKVGIPDDVLKKRGKLTDEEFSLMKQHSEIGFNILNNSDREVLKAAAIVSLEHHEKWDGSGYPHGLKGEEIHIFGRITAIADVFDALGSDRCYKKAWEDEKIFNLLEEEKGKHFDPILINLFFRHKDEILEVRDRYKD